MKRELNFGQMSTRWNSWSSSQSYVKVNLFFCTKRFVNTKEKRPIEALFFGPKGLSFLLETEQEAVIENRHVLNVFAELIGLKIVLF